VRLSGFAFLASPRGAFDDIVLRRSRREPKMVSRKRCSAGWLALLVLVGSSWATTGHAEPHVNPTAAELRIAAERFDEGRNAFKAGAFVEAAEHFEAADARAPSASALGLAMRSRAEAGQASRAATLAELVLLRHPDDSELVERASAIIEASAPDMGRVKVECKPACDLVVDDKLIHGRANERWTLYLESGEHVVSANWSRDRVVTERLTAVAGVTRSLSLVPAEPMPTQPAALPPKVPVSQRNSSPVPNASPGQSKGLPPVVFWVGVGTTVALGGAAIWSGIDTLNNPGPEAVRAGCVGLGDSCRLYRQGQMNELRTNVLIGATAVFAVASAVTGLFFTDFSRPRAARNVGTSFVGVRPWVDAVPVSSARSNAGRAGLTTVIGAEGRF
jgi:hypothetical protein